MKPIIVIPTYNERENIAELIKAIFTLHISDLEIIVVDDGSPDGTAEVVAELEKLQPQIHLIRRRGKLGLGTAYVAGFKKALALGADYFFEMDADFSHDPKDIPRLLTAAQTADLVIGSRKVHHGKIEGWNWYRGFISAGAMWFSRLVLSLKTKDVTAGFRVYNRKILTTIPLEKIKSNGYAFQEEMLYRTEKLGFRIREIPVTFIDRQQGHSKLSNQDIIEFFVIMLKLRFARKN